MINYVGCRKVKKSRGCEKIFGNKKPRMVSCQPSVIHVIEKGQEEPKKDMANDTYFRRIPPKPIKAAYHLDFGLIYLIVNVGKTVVIRE